jgi:hypothetical protein
MIAKEMELPWRAVESMHWQMGQEDLASRANVPVFQPHISSVNKSSPNKRKMSKSPPTVGSDSSHGHGPTPSVSSSSLTRVRRSNSGTQQTSRKRTDSKTDKTALETITAVAGTEFPTTSTASLSHADFVSKPQEYPPPHHHAVNEHAHDDSGASAGVGSVASERDWAPDERGQTATGSTPRARSASFGSAVSSSAGHSVGVTGESRKLRGRVKH